MSTQDRKSTPWLEQAEPQTGVFLPSSVTRGLLHNSYGDVTHLGKCSYLK